MAVVVYDKVNIMTYKADYLQPNWKCKSFLLTVYHLAKSLEVPAVSGVMSSSCVLSYRHGDACLKSSKQLPVY